MYMYGMKVSALVEDLVHLELFTTFQLAKPGRLKKTLFVNVCMRSWMCLFPNSLPIVEWLSKNLLSPVSGCI